jgi:hypothetical protein
MLKGNKWYTIFMAVSMGLLIGSVLFAPAWVKALIGAAAFYKLALDER